MADVPKKSQVPHCALADLNFRLPENQTLFIAACGSQSRDAGASLLVAFWNVMALVLLAWRFFGGLLQPPVK